MREQIDIFDIGVEDKHYDYKKYFQDYDKPIKLFEAFAGVGCQAMAFKRLGIDFETVGISEIDKYAITSYNAIHGKTKNYGDICKMTHIPECDIFTWSFPCTDLSKAGKREGLQGGTRSGLVYEVLRLLHATTNKPKVLIMENVPDLVQETFMAEFYEIQKEIESLGYKNYTQRLNAKHYGVAQNRDRVFMVSLLGGGRYEFPPREKLTKRLKDYLEDEVDEKYYLSDKMVNFFKQNSIVNEEKGNGFRFNPQDGNKPAKAITTRAGGRMDDNFLLEPKLNQVAQITSKGFTESTGRVYSDDGLSPTIQTLQGGNREPKIAIPEATKKGYSLASDGDGVYLNRPHQKRGVVQKGMIQTLKTSGDDVGVVVKGGYIENAIKETIENNNNIIPEAFDLYNRKPIIDGISKTLSTTCGQIGSAGGMGISAQQPQIKENNIITLKNIFGLCSRIETKESVKYERSKPLLRILWQEIGKKEIQQAIRRLYSVYKKEILQPNLYEESVSKDREQSKSNLYERSHNSENDKQIGSKKDNLRNVWEQFKCRYTPQRWELEEQQFRQLDMFMQELPYEVAQKEVNLQNLWETDEGFRLLQQTLYSLQEIWRSTLCETQSQNLRIRKLSPREVWRLMGISDEDFDKASKVVSNSQLYKQAGNGIVVDVFAAILKGLF